MCNDYEQHVTRAAYQKAMRDSHLSASDSESPGDLPQADDIKIGDLGPVLVAAGNGAALRQMRFGWPGARKGAPPVFNFKSDGRHFEKSRRCVVILSGFFEFTGTKYPKAKHRFTLNGSPIMGIAGLWHEAEGDIPESFTMLTTAPGPDIEPYHDRQVCVLRPEDWSAWLYLTKPEGELLKPLPAGTLKVETVRKGSD
ncbi:MAG: SOS response-associated peptidase [Devosia sp.]